MSNTSRRVASARLVAPHSDESHLTSTEFAATEFFTLGGSQNVGSEKVSRGVASESPIDSFLHTGIDDAAALTRPRRLGRPGYSTSWYKVTAKGPILEELDPEQIASREAHLLPS